MAHFKATGKKPPELDLPLIPPGTEGILQAFYDLHATRPSGLGPSAIPLSEIHAWQEVMAVRLTPWEIDTLLHLDRTALAAMSEQP